MEALKAAYDQIDQKVRAGKPLRIPKGELRQSALTNRPELDAREEEKKKILRELHALQDRVLEVDRLRQENEDLKAEIARRRDPSIEASALPKGRVVLGALSLNKPASNHHVTSSKDQPENELMEVAKNLQRLKAQYREIQKTCLEYKTKLRDRNKTIREWADHADLQEIKIQELRNKLKGRRAVRDSEKDEAPSFQDVNRSLLPSKRPSPNPSSACLAPTSSSLFTVFSNSTHPVSTKRIGSEPLLQDDPAIPTSAVTNCENEVPSLIPINTVADELISVSSVPVGDNELPTYTGLRGQDRPVTIKSEPSSDGPVFASTRTVRKRKREKHETQSNKLQKIKSEHSSSSVSEVVSDKIHSSAAESIDYEKEVHVPTPRKRRTISRILRAEYDIDKKPTTCTKRLNIEESVASDFQTLYTVGTPSKFDSRAHTTCDSGEAQRDEPQLLRPPQSPSSRHSSKIRSHHPPRLNVGVMDLAEDGENGSETISHPAVKGRLETLLNPPSQILTPAKQCGLANRVTLPAQNINDYEESFKLAPRRELPFKPTKTDLIATGTPVMRPLAGNPSPQPSVVRQRGPKKPSILRDDLPRGRPMSRESTPLRERPTDRLMPEDFKPNPRHNDGLTYVFDEVVRGKEARAALSGCIDPTCCGKTFRHFAEVERRAMGSSVTSRAEDIKLLETYLGDEAWRLGTMSPEEKEETWLLAKTWELANKFGKHRQRYSRMPTPPGFWNVDFPSTQERTEERRQAEEIRKALVRQRYREAMRVNGAWLFRDEEPH